MNDNVIVRLENVYKSFPDVKVLKGITLDIYEGEFITFLGPSGCGKTVLLRMINGLQEVSSGKVYIEGEDVTEVIPAKRKVNTIFQNFALFPHMTVWDNINFGLKMHNIEGEEAEKPGQSVLHRLRDPQSQNPAHGLQGGPLRRHRRRLGV